MKLTTWKLNIATQIIIGFMAVLILFAVISTISIKQVNKVDGSYANLLKRRELVIENVKQLKAETITQEKAIIGLLLTGDEEYTQDYSNSLEIYNQTFEQFSATAPNESAKKQIDDLRLSYDNYRAILERMIDLQKTDRLKATELLSSNELTQAEQSYTEQINGILNVATSVMAQDQIAAAQKTKSINNMLIWTTAIAMLMCIAISLFISRFISKPVKKVSKAMEKLANGDFSIEPITVRNRDEIGEMVGSMNHMVKDLGLMLSKVSESSDYLASSTEELAASSDQSKVSAGRVVNISQQSATGAQRQLELYRGTSVKVDRIVTEVVQISQSSKDMLEATLHSRESIQKADTLINHVVTQMNDINATTENTTNVIRTLEEHSNNISAIVSMITNISKQTNVLAFNAAIEAARAGERGKGFSVVASEIHNLAEESRISAEKVVDMIDLIQQGIQQAVKFMEYENQLVANGLTSTNEVKIAFIDIESFIDNVIDRVRDVSASVEEIKDFSKQIANEIEHVNQLSEDGLQLSQESSAASEEQFNAMGEMLDSVKNLTYLAEELQRQANRFKI